MGWAPVRELTLSEGSAANSLAKIKKIIYPRRKKFKPPRKLLEWIEGRYEPSKDDLERFRRKVYHHFGERTILEKVVPQEKKDVFEKIREETRESLKIAGIVDFYDEDWKNNHPLIKLKRYIKTRNRKPKKQKTLKETEDCQEEEEGGSEGSVSDEGEEEDGSEEESEAGGRGGDEPGPGAAAQEEGGEETPEERPASLPEQHQPGHLLSHTEAVVPKTPVIRTRIIERRQLKKEEWAEEVDSGAAFRLGGLPAMSFPFQLDGFQKQAIQALESGYNVFVSAHTSAGKTVVAEYAIAMSKRNRSKAVYTSPVKALSNQKYADFKRVFGSVGLITGDIQLNETAECLIMTTEILRSMLYNSSEKIRDLEFVVFDEVHYINDPERGHVWEEVLILLPSQVQIVMLSATVPNTMEFANWVGRTKQRKVMVCGTSQRPVPLQHYLYTGTGGSSPGETYLIKDGDGPFILTQYYKAEGVMKQAMEKEKELRKKAARQRQKEEAKEWKTGGKSVGRGRTEDGSTAGTELEEREPGKEFMSPRMKREKTMWVAFVSFLQKRDWLPTVVFVFSRKLCDNLSMLLSCEDLTTKSEKSFIHRFIKSQVEKLDVLDQDLPQIQVMQRHLLLGIGVHHSGILPVMKEIVEVLFQEGKVKLLFATETFAMGVNMPARTVVFHSIKKFDGCQTRLLLPAEYVQMAGRAGRRGKDLAGNVIIRTRPDEIIDRNSLEQLMFGNPSKLTSRFRLSYRMILNTLTMSGMISVHLMMARSYCENQGQLMRHSLEKDLAETEKTEKALKSDASEKMSTESLDELSKFYELAEDYCEKWSEIRGMMLSRTRLSKELVAGRLIQICQGHLLKRTGVILDVLTSGEERVFRVLLLDQSRHFTAAITPPGVGGAPGEVYLWYQLVAQVPRGLPPEPQLVLGPGDFLILTVQAAEVVAVCRECIKLQRVHLEQLLIELAQKIGSRFRTNEYAYSLSHRLCSLLSNITLIDERGLNIDGYELKLKVAELWSLEDSIKQLNIQYSEHFLENFLTIFQWKQKEKKMKILQKSVSYESMKLYPDLMNKLALLKYKQYISEDEENTVLMKGFMAARVGKYELIVCELLVENVLEAMEAEEVAALLSFLVYQSSGPEDVSSRGALPASLVAGIERCEAIIRAVTELEKSFAIEDYEGSDTAKLKFGLVHIMYAWAKQKPFKEIMEMTEELQEGMLVRWIQQLLETLKDVEAAARVMGDPGVPSKLQQAGQSIKRGIVFAPSLYTTLG